MRESSAPQGRVATERAEASGRDERRDGNCQPRRESPGDFLRGRVVSGAERQVAKTAKTRGREGESGGIDRQLLELARKAGRV